MYAEVLVEYSVKSLDKTFDYIIPTHLSHLKLGMKVLVPFGKQTINGFVINIKDNIDSDYELKEIISIVDENIVLNDELMSIGNYMNSLTLCSLITAYQTMLPSGLKVKNNKNNLQLYYEYLEITDKYIDYINNNPKKKKSIEIINYVLDNENVLKSDFTSQNLRDLIKEGIITIRKEKRTRLNPYKDDVEKFELTPDQKNVINSIKMNENNIYLLHGVTGSGKTEVYLRLIKDTIKNNKNALMLVPEISLTAQVVQQFYDTFGSEVAVFHSGLSIGEKYDEYLKIYNQEVKIVVGTRSGVFTPLTNIGIIIIDEEHSDSYKQDNNPRYHVLDIAKFRGKYHNCPIILGSATPTLESYARAKKGVYQLLNMEHRVGNSKLPDITLVNMINENRKGNLIFSDLLIDKINDRLNKEEQIIILLNRRGFSTIVNCQNCGHTYECPSCGITLTYHKSSDTMRCHYCGYSKTKPNKCDNCHEDTLKDFGLGTEKLEIELKNIFPSAKIIRMDADTTSKKGSHETIINDFKNKKYDILLGTQMIAKGLDFPYVSLVGVINADASLNIPDFRSNERTFQLLHQVSGRAGRNKYPGEVILQTFNDDNETLNYLKNNDYLGFYNYEMELRKLMSYPPYYYLISIKIVNKEYDEVAKESKKVLNYLKNNLKNAVILGPTVASPLKVNNNYRFQIIIKYKFNNNILNILRDLDDIYKTNKTSIEIDTSPLRF